MFDCETFMCPNTRKSGVVGGVTERRYQKWQTAKRVKERPIHSDLRQISQGGSCKKMHSNDFEKKIWFISVWVGIEPQPPRCETRTLPRRHGASTVLADRRCVQSVRHCTIRHFVIASI